jgi:putative aldouronate transport system substrate-binding protein
LELTNEEGKGMKFKRKITVLVLAVIMLSLTACGSSFENDNNDGKDAEDYTYGLNETFYSNEPVSYTMLYSNHEYYPYKKNWLFWHKLKEITNVSFDLDIIPRTDYDTKKELLIKYEKVPYIISKVYSETEFISSGQILPISDFVKYMPNYINFVEKYKMEDDLKSITREDGKYYRLPGMWEQPNSEYSLLIRKDVFDAAGVDIAAMEQNWTWEDFYVTLKKVADTKPGEIIWSDRWSGEAILQLVGAAFGVPAGWSENDDMIFNYTTDSFCFAETSQHYKEFVTYFNKLVTEGILDKKTFTQQDIDAKEKFINKETYIISANKSETADCQKQMEAIFGTDNFELYMIVPPIGPVGNYQYSNSRLENGLMISKNALKELGEKDFIKMLRFIDWLWYSDEGQTFCKWGVEGETYTVENGVKVLKSDISYGGINSCAEKALNVDYGFSNGVFMYGGSASLAASMLDSGLKDYFNRLYTYRDIRPLIPVINGNEKETEQMNLIKEALKTYVKTATLEFITGKKNIQTSWNEYVKACKLNSSDVFTKMYNKIYLRNKK